MLGTRHEGRKEEEKARRDRGRLTRGGKASGWMDEAVDEGRGERGEEGGGVEASQLALLFPGSVDSLPPRGDSDFKPLPCFIFPPGYCSQINLAGLPAVTQASAAALPGPRSPPYGVENSEEQVGGGQIC